MFTFQIMIWITLIGILLFLLVKDIFGLFKNYSYQKIKNSYMEPIHRLMNNEEYEKAKYSIFFEIPETLKKDADIKYIIGYLHYQNKEVFNAKKEFTETIKINKKHAAAHYSLGYTLFYDEANHNGAINELNNAIKYDKNLAKAYNTLSIVYDSRGMHKEALKIIQKAMRIKGIKNDSNIYNTMGIIYAKKSDYERAIQNFNNSVKNDPKNADAYINLGNIYSLRLDYALAINAFEKAEELQSDNKFIKYWIGCLHYLLKQYEDSVIKLKEAVKLDINFAAAYLQLSQSYYKMGNEEDYKINYNKAIELDPNIVKNSG